MLFFSRERQDADGQMKELQDQLEAEQYFSVLCFFILICLPSIMLALHLPPEPSGVSHPLT